MGWSVKTNTKEGNENDNRIEGKVGGNGDPFTSKYGYEDKIYGYDKGDGSSNSGNDTLIGGWEDDSLFGGDGNDLLYGDSETTDRDHSNDYTIGFTFDFPKERAAGQDYIEAGEGDDSLYGGAEKDTLLGDEGDDFLSGGLGADLLEGGDGDDILDGYNGTDTLNGGDGNDVLSTGALNDGDSDVLTGGSGADTFYLGEVDEGSFTAGGVDWTSLALSLAGDVNSVFFTAALPDAKIAKQVVPAVVDVVKAFMAEEDDVVEAPDAAAYATITDFDPTEDVVIIPLADSGNINAFLSTDLTNTQSDMTFVYDSQDGADIFATLEFASASEILGDSYTTLDNTTQESFQEQLMDNALVIDSSGAVLGSGEGETLDLDANTQEDLNNLGTRFLVVGAYSGVNAQGDNSDDYLMGTNYGDVLSGYQLDSSGGTSFAPESSGDDQLRGFGGNDMFYGGSGTDVMIGDEGLDMVSYIHSEAGIKIDFSNTGSDAYHGTYVEVEDDGFGDQDKLFSIENIIGSEYEDTVTFEGVSSGVSVAVYTFPESDTDEISVSEGTYSLAGIENITGSAHHDTADLTNISSSITIPLKTDTTGSITVVDDATNETFTLTNFETIITSASGQDVSVVVGTSNSDSLTGGDGDDFLVGGDGADVLTGGDGADIFYITNESDFETVDRITDFDPSEGDIIVVDEVYGVNESWLGYDSSTETLNAGGLDVAVIEGAGSTIPDGYGYKDSYNIITTDDLSSMRAGMEISSNVSFVGGQLKFESLLTLA